MPPCILIWPRAAAARAAAAALVEHTARVGGAGITMSDAAPLALPLSAIHVGVVGPLERRIRPPHGAAEGGLTPDPDPNPNPILSYIA